VFRGNKKGRTLKKRALPASGAGGRLLELYNGRFRVDNETDLMLMKFRRRVW